MKSGFHRMLSYLKKEGVSKRVTQAEDEIFFGVFRDGLDDAVLCPHGMFRNAVVIDARSPVCLVEKQSASWEDKWKHSLKHHKVVLVSSINTTDWVTVSRGTGAGYPIDWRIFTALLIEFCSPVAKIRNAALLSWIKSNKMCTDLLDRFFQLWFYFVFTLLEKRQSFLTSILLHISVYQLLCQGSSWSQ